MVVKVGAMTLVGQMMPNSETPLLSFVSAWYALIVPSLRKLNAISRFFILNYNY